MWSALNRIENRSTQRHGRGGGGDPRLGRGNREDVQQVRLPHTTTLLTDNVDDTGTRPAQQVVDENGTRPAPQTALERFEETLGLPPRRSEHNPSESELARLQKRFDLYFDHCRRLHKKCRCSRVCSNMRCRNAPVILFEAIPTGFLLDCEFIRWFERNDGAVGGGQLQRQAHPLGPLFCDTRVLNETYFRRPDLPTNLSDYDPVWLFHWEVRFENVWAETFAGRTRGMGPARSFMSQVWRQLGEVEVQPRVYLFESFAGNLWPQINDRLRQRESTRRAVHVLGRAMGRMILHAITNRHKYDIDADAERFTVPDYILPRPYRYYLLQGVKPTDERYNIRDLYEDFLRYSFTEHRLMLLEHDTTIDAFASISEHLELFCQIHGIDANQLTPAQKLRKAAEVSWIDNRSDVLDSIREGLGNSNGNHKSLEFAGLDLIDPKTLYILFFSKTWTTAEDVIKVLRPCRGSYESDGPLADDQRAILDESNGQARGHLVELLRRWEETGRRNFVGDFVEFVNGSRDLPQHGARILVEFCHGEDGYEGHPESLPVAHTCCWTLKLPATAYGGEFDVLERKLEWAISEGRGHFSMP